MIKLKEPLLFHQAAKYNDEQLRSLWQIFCDYPEGDHCVFGKYALQVSYTNVADNSVRINKGAFGIWIHDESKDKEIEESLDDKVQRLKETSIKQNIDFEDEPIDPEQIISGKLNKHVQLTLFENSLYRLIIDSKYGLYEELKRAGKPPEDPPKKPPKEPEPPIHPRKFEKDFLYIGRSDQIITINLPSPPLSDTGRKDYIVLRFLKTDVYIEYTGVVIPESDYILATITREAGRSIIHPDDIKDHRRVFEYVEPEPIRRPSEPGVPETIQWNLDNDTWEKNDRLVDIRDEAFYRLLKYKFDKDQVLEVHYPEHTIRVIQLKNIAQVDVKCRITNLGSVLSTMTHNLVVRILGFNISTGEKDLLFDNVLTTDIQTTVFQPSHFRNVVYSFKPQTSEWYVVVGYREIYVNAYVQCHISNYPGFTLDSTEIVNEINIIGKVEKKGTKEPLPKPPPKKDPPPEKKPPEKDPPPEKRKYWKEIFKSDQASFYCNDDGNLYATCHYVNDGKDWGYGGKRGNIYYFDNISLKKDIKYRFSLNSTNCHNIDFIRKHPDEYNIFNIDAGVEVGYTSLKFPLYSDRCSEDTMLAHNDFYSFLGSAIDRKKLEDEDVRNLSCRSYEQNKEFYVTDIIGNKESFIPYILLGYSIEPWSGSSLPVKNYFYLHGAFSYTNFKIEQWIEE